MMDWRNPVDVIVASVSFVAVAILVMTAIPMIASVESIIFIIQIHCRKYAEYRMEIRQPVYYFSVNRKVEKSQ